MPAWAVSLASVEARKDGHDRLNVKDTDSDELHLTGHLAGSAHPVLSQTVSGPDGIPSDVTAPDPGCWRLTLAWTSGDDSYRDSINLEYLAHR